MKKTNPLKLTLVIVPLAIVLTLWSRYLMTIILGNTLHPAFTLVTYIILFAVLKIAGEKMMSRGRYPWFLSQEK